MVQFNYYFKPLSTRLFKHKLYIFYITIRLERAREPDHKLAYGSDEFPSNLQIAKPTRDIFCEKSLVLDKC